MAGKKTYNLDAMFAEGKDFKVGSYEYKVYPLSIAHATEFLKTNVSLVGIQNFMDVNAEKELAKWFGEVKVTKNGNDFIRTFIRYKDGADFSYEQAMKDGWTVKDVQRYLRLLVDLSD